MKEYKCVMIKLTGERTEKMLNELAKEGWRVRCSYSRDGYWLILEKKTKANVKGGRNNE